MKRIKLLLTSFILLLTSVVNAQMVLEYDIVDENTEIALPLNGDVNVSVNWGDGSTIETFTTPGNKPHTYTSTGTNTVTITGTLTQFGSGSNVTGNTRLTKVRSWDGLGIISFNYAFYNAYLLTTLPTTLPSTVTNLSDMFYNATVFNQPIDIWNTAAITNMRFMFYNASSFNQPIENWNTAAVTDMAGMFEEATDFNQAIGNWNTSAVTDMNFMFFGATSFNQPIGTWNTEAVTDMSYMFSGATSFNQPIGTWNTAAVIDMNFMFSGATSFNQSIGNWNTAVVRNMRAMFNNATSFNKPIGSWNTAAVTDMNFMFGGATNFNQPIDNWNTAAVTSMSLMFYNATSFNQPIGSWNTAAVTDMNFMFENAVAFNHPLGTWNITAAVYGISGMFNNTGLCTDNYDATLNGWASQAVLKVVHFNGGYSKYSSAGADARATLINGGWIIADAGLGSTADSKCGTLATKQSFANDALKIYPNPATDRLQINILTSSNEVLNYSIYSNTGVLILENREQLTGANLEIEISDLPQGLYILKVNTSDQSIAKTFVKK